MEKTVKATMEETTMSIQELSEEQLQDVVGGSISDTVIAAAAQFRTNAAKGLLKRGDVHGAIKHLKGTARILEHAL